MCLLAFVCVCMCVCVCKSEYVFDCESLSECVQFCELVCTGGLCMYECVCVFKSTFVCVHM